MERTKESVAEIIAAYDELLQWARSSLGAWERYSGEDDADGVEIGDDGNLQYYYWSNYYDSSSLEKETVLFPWDFAIAQPVERAAIIKARADEAKRLSEAQAIERKRQATEHERVEYERLRRKFGA